MDMDRERFSKIILIGAIFVLLSEIIARVFDLPAIALCYSHPGSLSTSISMLPIIFGIIIGFALTSEYSIFKKFVLVIIILGIYAIVHHGIF